MAPSVNGVSPSPRQSSAGLNPTTAQESPNLSRRTSGIMGPPPIPANTSLPNSPRPPPATMLENTPSGAYSGPIRHPRPLTAAELHLELEKEQESIVNRLTRELSALRAQTASVASTTSSTSDLFTSNPSDPYLYPYQSGIVPTTARRHRSSSNLSSRSARSARDALANAATATSVSGVAAPRERDPSHSHQASSRPSVEISRPEMSRQNSTSGSAMNRTPSTTGVISGTSPHWGTVVPPGSSGGHYHQYSGSRHSISSNYSSQAVDHGRSPSFSTASATARYEEAERQKAELEAVKRENEILKMRIRDLERSLAEKKPTSTTAAATDSPDTNAPGLGNP